MPRKQNGFGSANSLGFKQSKSVSKGKAAGAAGFYPSERRYGSSVHRSVIEKWDLDSDWVKWRRGFEYYNKGAWYRLKEYNDKEQTYSELSLQSKLYQGTEYEIDVQFDGYKFATRNSDTNNHYVLKRTTTTSVDLGTIDSVQSSADLYPENKANREIWATGTAGPQSRLLLQMLGDRLSDGETEATLLNVLNSSQKPVQHVGKTLPEQLTEVTARVNKAGLMATEFMQENLGNVNALVGKLVYIPEFFVEKAYSDIDSTTTTDGAYFWQIEVEDTSDGQVIILNPEESDLPPSLYDVANLDPIYNEPAGQFTLNGKFVYEKAKYQKYYGAQYLTGEMITDIADFASYSLLPFEVIGAAVDGDYVYLKSVAFQTEFKVDIPIGERATLIFADWSFTKLEVDDYDGVYYHAPGAPGTAPWMRLDTDVDPWMDSVFSTGNPIQPATTYSCSCPNYSNSMIRAPQQTEDEGTRKVNRQRRYPLPTVQGKASFDQLGLAKAAGVAESWESEEHRMSHRMCKHTIAAMFIEKIKVKEPNSYQSREARAAFESKLQDDIAEVGEEFVASYKRGGITAVELVFALSEALNLDEVETAYILLNNRY